MMKDPTMVGRRVALVETYPVPGGGEGPALSMARRETAIARLLERRGCEVRCFRTIRSHDCSTATDDDVEWSFTPIDTDTWDQPDRLTRSSELVRELGRFDPDIIFVKGVGTAASEDLLGLEVGTRIAIIGGAHRTEELTRYDLVLIETPAQAEFLGSRIGRTRLVTLPKYASEEFFEVDRPLRPSVDVVAVGRLIPLKNLGVLSELPPARGYRITICGDGPLLDELRAQFAEHGSAVEFAGQLTTAELADMLGRSRVLAHPSRSEGLPRAVIEAMAAGTPPIFIQGVIESPVLNESNSVATSREAFADEVQRLLQDEARRERLSEECRRTAAREFSLQRLETCVEIIAERLLVLGPRHRADLGYRRVTWRLYDLPSVAAAKLRRSRVVVIAIVRRVARLSSTGAGR